jgi:hypothetical protein
MALFGWFRRLFRHTAAAPPAMHAEYRPAGLERPDPPETLVPHVSTEAATREACGNLLPLAQAGAPVGRDEPSGDAALEPALASEERPAATAKRRSRARQAEGFGEVLDDDVYGLTFAIEYESASGDFSRRRIMLRAVSVRDDGVVFLRALCFERNALRCFRLDRVQSIIDADGVIHEDAAAFLRDELRLSIPAPSGGADATASAATASPGPPAVNDARSEAPGAEKPGMAQRRVARDGLRVLCALGRADGLLHPAEVEVVLDYIEAACRAANEPCGAEDRAALAPYVRRQRPGLDVLEACLQRIEAGDEAARSLLLDYAERLIAADGEEHDAELRLLAQMRQSASQDPPTLPSVSQQGSE